MRAPESFTDKTGRLPRVEIHGLPTSEISQREWWDVSELVSGGDHRMVIDVKQCYSVAPVIQTVASESIPYD